MITDFQAQLSSAQVVTASAVSTNTIDLSQVRDIGAGEELNIAITVDTTVTAAGAATVTFQVITSASANLGTPTIIGQTDAIGKASLAAGVGPIYIPIPRAFINTAGGGGQRYLGLQYTIATGPLTGGSFTANVVIDVADSKKFYASGFTVN